jgi:hypothetical protein
MPRVGFEIMTPVFERGKRGHALDCAATVIGGLILYTKKKLRGLSPQRKLYRPSNRRLSAKLVSTLADRDCRVVSATNPHGR